MSIFSIGGGGRGGGGGNKPNALEMTPSTAASSLPPSPFFAPSSSTGTKLTKVSTPGGTQKLRRQADAKESKSSLSGASFNLINTIVGAGIVGIPFAVKEAGLVSGVLMVVLCAALTVKSLRILIETAKHIDVPSYETLCEAAFGKPGFLFISLAMFVNAYGAMVSYLMIVKATLPMLLGVHNDDAPMKRAVLVVSTAVVMLPLCMQRDMAALAKTSVVSVCFDIIMVCIVAVKSPWRQTVADAGGIGEVIKSSTFRPETFFIGLAVLSFAFVCQHGAFIIAGSLRRPTKERWGKVSLYGLSTCGLLAATCGSLGYLGYLEETDGNILNNLGNGIPGLVARSLMCCAMFFVYPMESFVARHVTVVMLFKGRRAHDGDDHAVLARTDRRVALTLSLYVLSLIPALIFDDLGNVLAVSGSIGGSCLSYLGPGGCYLAIHGDSFLETVRRGRWGYKLPSSVAVPATTAPAAASSGNAPQATAAPSPAPTPAATPAPSSNCLRRLLDELSWYLLLLPLWTAVASLGQRMLDVREEQEALKSPHVGRLGKVVHRRPVHGIPANHTAAASAAAAPTPAVRSAQARSPYRAASTDEDEEAGGAAPGEFTPLVKHSSFSTPRSAEKSPAAGAAGAAGTFDPSQYGKPGAVNMPVGNRGIAAAIAARKKRERREEEEEESEEEEDPQEDAPTGWDFFIAIAYVVFGVVAMTAGLGSIFLANDAPTGGRRLMIKYT